jgi:hypothetical protein
VRFWAELQAIANAMKHRNISTDYWVGGANVSLLRPDRASEYIWRQADEEASLAQLLSELKEGSVWYENIFHTPGTGSRVLASQALLQNYEDWHSLVHEVGPASWAGCALAK